MNYSAKARLLSAPRREFFELESLGNFTRENIEKKMYVGDDPAPEEMTMTVKEREENYQAYKKTMNEKYPAY